MQAILTFPLLGFPLREKTVHPPLDRSIGVNTFVRLFIPATYTFIIRLTKLSVATSRARGITLSWPLILAYAPAWWGKRGFGLLVSLWHSESIILVTGPARPGLNFSFLA